MLINICIASYCRPEGLKRLLKALARQSLPADAEMRIIVVDNDKNGSAKDVVTAFGKSFSLEIIYDLEREKNIALARNRCLSHVKGDYLAFIDDDEEPDEKWLLNLMKALESYQADIVMGPVIPVYPEQAPGWVLRHKVFDRKRIKTGEKLSRGRTGNALLMTAIIPDGCRFDPELGLSGGEDSDFFHRLTMSGAQMIWCDEAAVKEYIGSERLSLGWLLKRDFRSGGCYYHVFVRASGRSGRVRWFGLRIIYLSFLLPAFILCPVLSGKARLFVLRKLAASLGQLCRSIGYQYEEYK